MFKEHAELMARADECVAQARQEMEAAARATEESCCTDRFRAASEWLKLAAELCELMKAGNDAPTIIPDPDPAAA